jgi:hypothetical protein
MRNTQRPANPLSLESLCSADYSYHCYPPPGNPQELGVLFLFDALSAPNSLEVALTGFTMVAGVPSAIVDVPLFHQGVSVSAAIQGFGPGVISFLVFLNFELTDDAAGLGDVA